MLLVQRRLAIVAIVSVAAAVGGCSQSEERGACTKALEAFSVSRSETNYSRLAEVCFEHADLPDAEIVIHFSKYHEAREQRDLPNSMARTPEERRRHDAEQVAVLD